MAAIMHRARAGDLIIIQENVMFDNYTMLNAQVCHWVKQLLRMKIDYQRSVSDEDDPPLVHQWCRCGIICDSSIPDVKYLLEITPDGIEENELFSRLLIMKKEGKIIAYKPLARSFTPTSEMLSNLDFMRTELRSKSWDDLAKLEREGEKHKEALKIFNWATIQSKVILTTLHDDRFLFNSLFKVFRVFVQTLADKDGNPDEQMAPRLATIRT